MSEATPSPDPMLAEFIRDNAEDDKRARELVAAMTMGQQVQRLISLEAQQMAAQRNDKLVDAFRQGPGINKREAAVYILAGMSASTSKAAKLKGVRDSLAVLDEIFPEG